MKQQFIVLIECTPGEAYSVAQQILKVEPRVVTATYSTSGAWDLLLRVEYEAGGNFGEAVAQLLHNVDGIIKTHTLVGFPIWDPEDVFF